MPRPQRKKRLPASTQLNTESNGRRLMAIPELLTLIIDGLDAQEQRKLMRVSKHFFGFIGPIAWKSIPRLDVIMRLIKNANIKLSQSWAPYKYQFVTTFPSRTRSKPDLSRYDIYAPWVQELEIYGGYYQEIADSNSFLTLLGGRPPLPNLRRLTAYTIAPIDGQDLMDFFNMFISPSLTELRTIIPNEGLPQISGCSVPPLSVPKFLEKIQKTCPQIHVLEFYPEDRYASNRSQRYIPSNESRSILSSFLNLRSFSSTTYTLESAIFSILGQLPHLESLGIRGSPVERSVLDKQLSIPETWFPVLKELRLYDVDPEDIQVLWNQPNIAKKLTSLLIQADDTAQRYENDSRLRGTNWLHPFLEALPGLSPLIQDVVLYMGSLDSRIEIPRHHWKYLGRDGDIYYAFHDYRAAMYSHKSGWCTCRDRPVVNHYPLCVKAESHGLSLS
ncbi:unnamed protein product [Rhizoctonia solani]|uniref:Uncharacterized protein n=1 Tax=Rhizoctonia solani TaxID=456999 RepID=A0A8H3GAW1_9AGAM|nr:unnamed protein product [Rhizoctonia solani]